MNRKIITFSNRNSMLGLVAERDWRYRVFRTGGFAKHFVTEHGARELMAIRIRPQINFVDFAFNKFGFDSASDRFVLILTRARTHPGRPNGAVWSVTRGSSKLSLFKKNNIEITNFIHAHVPFNSCGNNSIFLLVTRKLISHDISRPTESEWKIVSTVSTECSDDVCLR